MKLKIQRISILTIALTTFILFRPVFYSYASVTNGPSTTKGPAYPLNLSPRISAVTEDFPLDGDSYLLPSQPTTTMDVYTLFQSAEEDWNAQKWEEALAKYELVAATDSPYASKAHIQIGRYDKYNELWDEALKEFEEAMDKALTIRDLEDAEMCIGSVHISTGNFKTALSIFEGILSKTTDWQQVKYSVYWIKELNWRMAFGKDAICDTCGISALKDLFRLKGIESPDNEIEKGVHLTRGGASMEDLKQLALSKGLKAHGVQLSLEQLKTIDKPVITLMQSPKHYIIVTAYEPKGIRIINPAQHNETYLMPEKEFGKVWKGHTLVFSEVRPEKVTAFLSGDEMKDLKGKECPCCPSSKNGTQMPNTAFDDNPNDDMLRVNTINLNLVVQNTDLSYKGRGPSVEIKRTYNADDHNDGPFGHSWTYNYNVTLTELPGGYIDIVRETGTNHRFESIGNGNYKSPLGVYDTLTKREDGTYSLKLKGSKLTQSFDASGKLTSITDRNGNSLTFQYLDSRLIKITDAVGRNTILNYGSNGKISSIVDPSGRTVTYSYDANNNLISCANMAGNDVDYGYDGNSYMRSITIYKGSTPLTTTIAYDSNHTIQSITDPMGNKKTYGKYYSNSIRRVVDANGNPTDYVSYQAYDWNGYTKEITDALGNKVTYEYDNKLNRISIQRSSLMVSGPKSITTKTTTLTYEDGNITSMSDPLENIYRFTYIDDNLTQFQDPAENTYNFEYDQKGNLKKIKYPNYPENGEATFGYNTYGEITDFTDARGTSYIYVYDNFGNRTASCITCHYHSEQHYYGYDDVGRVTSHTDPKNNTFSYTYDGIDRLTHVTYPDNFVKSYTYDLCCGISTVTDRNGTVAFTYNDANRLTEVTDVYGKTISYGFDKTGNLTSLTYPGNKTVTYAYDDANRLISVTDWLGNVTTYEYGITGNFIRTIYPDGSTTVQQFDKADRLGSLLDFKEDDTMNADMDFILNSIGNRTEISFYQPLNAIPPPQEVTYTYSYDNRLLTAAGTTFTNDNNGNLLSKTSGSNVTTYTWNYDNMLTDILVNNVTTHQFKYDGLGNKVAKIDSSGETRYIVDPSGALSRVLAETDASGNITAYYVYGLGLISKITPTDQAYYYHYDGLGSTIMITDSSGNVVNKYSYDEFGKVVSQTEAIPNPFKYVGRYGVMDEGNGLLYMRARYYAPQIGRFINKDPIGFAGGDFNLYAYVKNNPVGFIDPSGLKKECKCGKPKLNREEFKTCLIWGHSLFPAPAIGCAIVIGFCLTGNLQACALLPLVCGAEALMIYGCYDFALECPPCP